MGKLLMIVALATSFGSKLAAAETCNQWDVSGDRVIHQSNDIAVQLSLSQDGNKISGTAQFYSTAYHAEIGGPVEGFLDGNQLKLRANWFFFRDHCQIKALWFCGDPDDYHEHGIYEGSVDEHGQLQGSNWPFERPNARTSWFADGALACADHRPVFRPRPIGVLPGPSRDPAKELPKSPRLPPVIFSPAAPVTRVGGPSSRNLEPSMAGSFKTSFGTLVLAADGGRYDYKDGRVTVSRIDGDVVEGTWEQSYSGTRCSDGRYYGRFRFTFAGSGFTGAYGYCDDEPNSQNVWNGTRL